MTRNVVAKSMTEQSSVSNGNERCRIKSVGLALLLQALKWQSNIPAVCQQALIAMAVVNLSAKAAKHKQQNHHAGPSLAEKHCLRNFPMRPLNAVTLPEAEFSEPAPSRICCTTGSCLVDCPAGIDVSSIATLSGYANCHRCNPQD